MIIPVIIVGSLGILYYRDIIKQDIQEYHLSEAKVVAALTRSYINFGISYLTTISDRPLVIQAINERNTTFLAENAAYISELAEFDSAYFTDAEGNVISYYPHTEYVGQNLRGRPFVGNVLNTSTPYVSDGIKGDVTGHPTIYIGAPVVDNGTTIGVLVGGWSLQNYSNVVKGATVKDAQYIYLVNRTGHVMMHNNESYMSRMTDFSSLPVVREVLAGNEGVMENRFTYENDQRLAAYSPVNDYGWGVVVSLPVHVAYAPVERSSWAFLIIVLALLILAVPLSLYIGNYLSRPIVAISEATKSIPEKDLTEYEKSLPVDRQDEIGVLARSFLNMGRTIGADREKILDEKNRAELYLDIMGHDINNLNQVTIGNLELIKDDDNLTPDQKEIITDAIKSSTGSASIIDSVRKIQAINEEKITYQPEDLDQMIRQCIEGAPRPDGKSVAINYAPRNGLVIKGTSLMAEVFCNLINNSIKHSGDSIVIDIAVVEVQIAGRKFYQISVADNGPGIPDSLKEKIFNRFERGDTKAHGRGLGLFIVKSLVENAGGDVTVADRVPGDYSKGAKFIVSLPAAEEPT
ncbi:cache domain-containing protein [Methanocella sp. MCL-LM]|uniref:sensor histidine kinase n=1 Tax=Methanocella sp. MCL-LM TaxID=3412035 RepID=UPI003C716159